MSKDLVRQILEFNTHNHASVSAERVQILKCQDPAQESASLAALQAQLLSQIKARADRVLRRFEEEIQGLARTPPQPQRSSKQGLEETQRIGVEHGEAPRAGAIEKAIGTAAVLQPAGEAEMKATLVRVEERLNTLRDQLEAARSAERIQTHSFFERNLEHFASDIMRSFAEGFGEMRTGLDEQFRAQLSTIEGKLGSTNTIPQIHENVLQILARPPAAEPRISQAADGASATAPAVAADVVEIVRGVRKDISLLVHTLNNHLEETSKIQAEVGSVKELLTSLRLDLASAGEDPAGEKPVASEVT